jgi:UDP-glucose 4-epimerase
MIPTPEGAGPLLPISLYGAAKLACEALVSAYCHLFGMRAWMFRFANVVGVRMGHGVIHDFIQKLRRDPHELDILGDGQQQKPFFLVDDCIEGMLCAFNSSDSWCDVYNLGCATTTKIHRVAEIVVEEMGLRDVKFKYTGGRRGWPGDVPQVFLDVSRMKKLGWEVNRHSDEAVRIAARGLLGKQ